jgi:nicotinate phosphoribosyltransferase
MNLALLTDLYQLTMMGGYLANGKAEQVGTFDLYFRRIPLNGGFCLAAGLEPAMQYIESLHFDHDDLDYLQSLQRFPPEFIEYLKNFRFTGDVMAVEEGTVIFGGEPLLRVTAPMPQAQLLETALLNIINFQTLIATKAARICHAAEKRAVLEFGLRRAQGVDGGLSASRAAYAGGCHATSDVLAGKLYGIPVQGTMAHSWVMSFDSELAAFRAYARAYPRSCALLVDTYDTLASGIPHAIEVAREMEQRGERLQAVRLDSGDLAYLSKESRRQLDAAGLEYVKIMASSDLDEFLIHDLLAQGAQIDMWGVGTRLITSEGAPALGGVYKLVAASDDNGAMVPRIKLSSNPEKTTIPGVKQIWRIFDEDERPGGDVLALEDERFEARRSVRSRHPTISWERRRFPRPERIEPLLRPVFEKGRRVYDAPSLQAVRDRSLASLSSLPAEHKRFYNAHIYWVGLSERLYELREELAEQVGAPA